MYGEKLIEINLEFSFINMPKCAGKITK